MNAYDKFASTYGFQKLLKSHTLDELGVWEVRGEDPNCDFGGYHHNPYMYTLKGTLEQVITKAVKDPNFWTWGGGGTIRKIEIIDLNNELSSISRDIDKNSGFSKF